MIGSFVPEAVFVQEEALDYDLGRKLMREFEGRARVQVVKARPLPSRRPGDPAIEYSLAKRTLVVAVRKALRFQSCKPSAHYQLPLVTSCPGLCEYCYLQTTLGPRPYVTVYVNVSEVLSRAETLIEGRRPEATAFEAGAAGDPVPVEPYTGSLAESIRFFAKHQEGSLRVATKFDDVETLLGLDHKRKTRFRISVNAPRIVKRHERGTPALGARLRAARLLAEHGYPVGFLVAPLIVFPGWEGEYLELARLIGSAMEKVPERPTLEFISHRFTARAKNLILERHPASELPLDEGDRVRRRGQFGYFKYVYPPETLKKIKTTVMDAFREHLPGSEVEYFI